MLTQSRATASEHAPLSVHWSRDRITTLMALDSLPEMTNCPHEIFEQLIKLPSPVPQRTAIVHRSGSPVALVALRWADGYWEPLTQGVASFAHLTTTLEHPTSAFAATGLDIHVNYWRGARPTGHGIHQQTPYGVHLIRKDSAYEEYWREAGHWGHIASARRRSRKLQVRIDAPGAASRIVKRWGARWEGSDAAFHESVELYQDYMAGIGRLHSFEIFDGNELVAGITFLAEGHTLYGQTSWTAGAERERLGAGTRCIDLAVQWGFENGFDAIDLGGGHSYKRFWAPATEDRWYFRACSVPRLFASRVGRLPQSVSQAARARLLEVRS